MGAIMMCATIVGLGLFFLIFEKTESGKRNVFAGFFKKKYDYRT